MHIKKGDQVVVISGDYKGQKGAILKVIPENNRAIVEGVNLLKRHMRPSQQNPQGGIVEKEGTIHVSNLMVIAPGSGEPTRISKKILDGDDKLSRRRVRYSGKFDEIISSGD